MIRTRFGKLTDQVKSYVNRKEPLGHYHFDKVISTGSTLLDLAISGGVSDHGGIPGGVLVEIFGPESSGKSAIICEIAGGIQRQGGQIRFFDPEARLNRQYSRQFGVIIRKEDYFRPNTVLELFKPIPKFIPKPKNVIHGILGDSLAALSTESEMTGSDKMGMKRAKDFSEQLRKVCRIIPERNILMVCSNQMRTNMDAGQYGPKDKSTGGRAIAFYASLRLQCLNPQKIKQVIKLKGGLEVKRVIGVETQVYVFKSSLWSAYRTAPVTIMFDYGIDDIRQNLQYIRRMTHQKIYTLGKLSLAKSIDDAIAYIELDKLESKLRQRTIDLWHEIEEKFRHPRKAKVFF